MSSDVKARLRKFWIDGWIVPALVYLLLVFIVVWPLGLVLNERFVGDPQGDFWKHVWGHWWVKDCLSHGIWPLFCRLLNSPSGGYLFVADPVNCLLDSILMSWLPLVTAYNTLILANVWAGCMAAWALTRHIVKNSWASMITGAVYGVSAYVLAYPVVSGVTETLNTAFIPMCMLYFHRIADTGRFRDVFFGAIFFFLTTFGCWYYGEFMVVYAAVLIVHRYWRGAREIFDVRWRFKTWRQRQAWVKAMKASNAGGLKAATSPLFKIAAAIALGGLMVAPFALVFQLVISDPANIVMPDRAPQRSLFRFQDYLGSNSPWSISARGVQGFHNHTNMVGFLLPGKGNATVTVTIDRLTRVHYLGWIALGLAWVGFRRRRELESHEQVEIRFWVGAGIFFLVLSLGPRFVFSDFSSAGFINPLYLAMYWLFPMFHKLAIPFRFLALALLCLGVVGSFGVKRWLEGQPVGHALGLAVFLPLAITLETAVVSPLPWPLPTSSAKIPIVYSMIGADKEDFSVIDYPFERPNSLLVPGYYFYYQTLHKRSIPYRTSGVLSTDVARSTFMEEISSAESGVISSRRSLFRLVRGAERLRAMGFKYLVLHEELLPGGSLEQIKSLLLPVLGNPVLFGDGVCAYELVPLQSAVKDAAAYEKTSGTSDPSKVRSDSQPSLPRRSTSGEIMGDQHKPLGPEAAGESDERN